VVQGKGRELGQALKAWIDSSRPDLITPQTIANRLIDALGADDSLKGPLRDLASQRLLLQALRQRGAAQRSALDSLNQQLTQTYSPAVLEQLLALLEAATGQPLARNTCSPSSESSPEPSPSTATELAPASGAPPSWGQILRGFGPGVALAAAAALVFSWLGHELDRGVFEAWGWSGGVVLVLGLALLQGLASGPLPQLQRRGVLTTATSEIPRQAWRWLTAPWIHPNKAEAAVNALLLLILLGKTALPLQDVLLRYTLTALATLLPAALLARRFGVFKVWGGAAGAISALIALAASLSLLQWRVLDFRNGPLVVPAWVLLLVYGALQLSWQLPRRDPQESSGPLLRLFSSPWWWGLVLGVSWGLLTWGRQQLR
jgi:hypothetical protein